MESNTQKSELKVSKKMNKKFVSFGYFQHSTFNIQHSARRGFTLIEMTVSLGLFTIVMFIATSSFLSVVQTDRKTRAVRVAADNLNIALEDMSRNIKTGSSYYCGPGGEALYSTQDCPTIAGNTLFFTNQNGDRVKYLLDPTTHAIWSSVGFDPIVQATSPEIKISKFKVLVAGSAPCGGVMPCVNNPPTTDQKQPMVTIAIDGTINAGGVDTGFKVQTTITQRAYDN